MTRNIDFEDIRDSNTVMRKNNQDSVTGTYDLVNWYNCRQQTSSH